MAREATKEEEEGFLRNNVPTEGPRPVNLRAGNSVERLLAGIGRGASLGFMPIPTYEEWTPESRLPRTMGEGVGGEMSAAALLAAASRLRGMRGPAGMLGRAASRAVSAAREKPGRAATAAGGAAAGYGLGAAYLPEMWESELAEPVGGLLGSLGGNAITSLGKGILSRFGLVDPAIPRGGRIVVDELSGRASNPNSLDPTTLEGNIAGLRDELSEVTGRNPGQTLAQTTQDPGIAGVEVDVSRGGRNPSQQSLGAVRHTQQEALAETAFPRGGNTVEGAANAAIREEMERSLKAAEDRLVQARSAIPAGQIRMTPVIEEVNRILANADPAEMSRVTMPQAVQHIKRLIQGGNLDRSQGQVGIHALLSMRDELERVIQSTRSPLARERSERMIAAIDKSIADSGWEGQDAFKQLMAAQADVSNARGASNANRSAVDTVLSSPENFESLVRIAGDRSGAVDMAKNILEQRFQHAVTTGGNRINGGAVRDFISDPTNRRLMTSAFGIDHVRNLERLGTLARRLKVEDIIPPGAAVGVRREIGESARATERAATTLFPKPLNRLTVHGWLRHIAGEAARRYGVSQTKVVEDMMANALSDPSYALDLLRRGRGSDADRAGRLVARIGPRYGLPAGRLYNEESEEGSNVGEAIRTLDDLYSTVRGHLSP